MRNCNLTMIATWLIALSLAVYSAADTPPGSATSAPADAPHLVIDQPTFDFGEVWLGDPLEHSFKITNTGKGVLNIIRVAPTCGCTAAGAYPDRIQPGESGMFPFKLDTSKLHGKFQKTINIATNDPSQQNVQLTLAGNCKRLVEISPPDASFGRLLKQKHEERILTITSHSQQPLIANLLTPPPNSKFQYMLLGSVPGKEYKLFVSIDPPFSPGTIDETVTITTNIDKFRSLTISVKAVIPKRVEVTPANIILPRAPTGPASTQPAMRYVMVNNYAESPVKILSAAADDPALKVTTREIKPGKQFRIDVQIPPGYAPPAPGRTVILKTDDPEFSELKVSVLSPPATPPKVAAAKNPTSRPARPAMQLLNQVAPPFAINTIDGAPLGTSEFKTYPATVLNFVAPNCGYCKRQLPNVETVRAAFEPRGIRFVNIVQTMHKEFSQEEVLDVMASVGSKSQLALDKPNDIGRKYKATSYPTLFVVDKTGTIVDVVTGAKPDLAAILTNRLEGILKSESGNAAGATSRPAENPAVKPVQHSAP